MSGKEKKPKVVLEEKLTCPHCKKKVIVMKTKKTIDAAVAGVYDEKVTIMKDSQKTLN